MEVPSGAAVTGEGHLRLTVKNMWGSLGQGSTRRLVTSVCYFSPLGSPNIIMHFSQEMVLWAGQEGDDSRGHRQGSEVLGALATLITIIRVTCHQKDSQESQDATEGPRLVFNTKHRSQKEDGSGQARGVAPDLGSRLRGRAEGA